MPPGVSGASAALLEKAAVDSGFDIASPGAPGWLGCASTAVRLSVWLSEDAPALLAAVDRADVVRELAAAVGAPTASAPVGAAGAWRVADLPALHALLRRAFVLARTLPDGLLDDFRARTAALPRATEVERLVVQRVGQDVFRAGLIAWWNGRCALTGLAVVELLRASHIKPWAACATDAERLDVFNGILLAPHLDAAFDLGFITLADDGTVMVSPALHQADRALIGLNRPLRASIAEGHHRYLPWHRDAVFRRG